MKKFHQLREDSQAASSDNPDQGGEAGPKSGKVDQVDNLNKDNDTNKNIVKTSLESIALQSAEMFDMITDQTRIEAWAQDKLSIAKDNLDELYRYISDRKNQRSENDSDSASTVKEYKEWPGSKEKKFFSNKETKEETRKWLERKKKEREARESTVKEAAEITAIHVTDKNGKVLKKYGPNDTRKARAHVDRLDNKYGAAVHRYTFVHEEVEDLDELSKKTLGSYIGKAARSSAERSYSAGEHGEKRGFNAGFLKKVKGAEKRISGINLATKKLANEENLSEIPGFVGGGIDSGKPDGGTSTTNVLAAPSQQSQDLNKRVKAVTRRNKKWPIPAKKADIQPASTNEEVEQIDELSKALKLRYVEKALKDASNRSEDHYNPDSPPNKKYQSRLDSTLVAYRRINKQNQVEEEVSEFVIESLASEIRKIVKTGRAAAIRMPDGNKRVISVSQAKLMLQDQEQINNKKSSYDKGHIRGRNQKHPRPAKSLTIEQVQDGD